MTFKEALEKGDKTLEDVLKEWDSLEDSWQKRLAGIAKWMAKAAIAKGRVIGVAFWLFVCMPMVVACIYWLANTTNDTGQTIMYMEKMVLPGETMYAYRDWLWIPGKLLLFAAWFYSVVMLTVTYALTYVAVRIVEKLSNVGEERVSPSTVQELFRKISSVFAWIFVVYALFVLLPFQRWPFWVMPVVVAVLVSSAYMNMGWIERPPVWAHRFLNWGATAFIGAIIIGLIMMEFMPQTYSRFEGKRCEMVEDAQGGLVKVDPECVEIGGASSSVDSFVDALFVGVEHMAKTGEDWIRGKEVGDPPKPKPKTTLDQPKDDKLDNLLEYYE